jgi:hypothetical protein
MGVLTPVGGCHGQKQSAESATCPLPLAVFLKDALSGSENQASSSRTGKKIPVNPRELPTACKP